MKKYLNLIRFLGIQKEYTYSEKRSVILLNEITLLMVIIEASMYLEVLFFGKWLEVLFIFCAQLLTIIPLILNWAHKTAAAKWFFNIVFTIAIMLVIMTHGRGLRADYSFLVFAITSMLFFSKWSYRFFIWIFIIACYYFSLYYTANYPAFLAKNVSFSTSSASFLGAFFTVIIIIFRFIVETENYETELNETFKKLKKEQEITATQNAKLEQANIDLGRFSYISSHNLKTPIRTIRSFTDLIERSFDKGKMEHFKEYLGFIKQGTAQMQLLITGILEFSRFNQQVQIEIMEVDLNKVAYYIHSQTQNFINKKVELEIGELPTIQSNLTFVNAIFQNIIENGIRYNESETAKISITYKSENQKHLLIFRDNGIGIEAKYYNKIFEMFQRLHGDYQYEGTGIGLAMTKKMIERLDGKIWLESDFGQGSTFFVELPKTKN